MAKVNTGTRSKAQENDALETLIDKETSTDGKECVDEGGKKYIKETTAFGVTVMTRIA